MTRQLHAQPSVLHIAIAEMWLYVPCGCSWLRVKVSRQVLVEYTQTPPACGMGAHSSCVLDSVDFISYGWLGVSH